MDRPFSTRSVADGSPTTSNSDSLSRSNNGLLTVTAPKHPEPYLSIPAQALLQDNCRVHSGMVRKENKYKKWQDRYLVLHKGCLYYYKDSTDKKAQGQFSLSGYRLSNAPERSKFAWTFKFTHIQAEKRTYFFATHSEKELNEWFEKIQQDMNEYCDPRPNHNLSSCDSNSSSSGSSYGYSSEENELSYDYPEVTPGSIEDMKQKFLRNSTAVVLPPSNSSEPDYCPPPEFVNINPTASVKSKGKFPPAVPSNKPGHQTAGLGGACDKGSVDVSKVLRPNLSSSSFSSLPTNPASVDIAQVLNQSLSIHGGQNTALRPSTLPRTSMRSPPSPQKPPPMPPPKPLKKALLPSSILSSSTDSLEEMYLELSNEPEESSPPSPPARPSTMQRMRPEGNSFKNKDNEPSMHDILPPSALRLDYNKMDAIPLLSGYDGAYMIHSSTRGDINQSLSVCTADKVKHFLIFYNQDGYALDPKGLRFPTVEVMLRHFYSNPLPNQQTARLRMPYK